MHGLINVKSPNNISKRQMGFNSAFKGLNAAFAFFIRGCWVSLIFVRIYSKNHTLHGGVGGDEFVPAILIFFTN
jgi:hypothetical protein